MQAPLLAEVLGLLEMIVLSLTFLGRGLDSVDLVSEQQKIALSLVILSVRALNFSLWLRPLTLSVDMVIRFLYVDGALGGFDVGSGEDSVVVL